MSHLVVVIDCTPSPSVNHKQFTKWLDSLISFCNSHLMLDEKNELTTIASFSSASKIIVSTNTGLGITSPHNGLNKNNNPSTNDTTSNYIISHTGQFEKFAFVTEILRTGIIDLITKNQSQVNSNDCLLATALGMALCKINSIKSMPSRILVASCSLQAGSYASQYMNLMNAFFSAQKLNVPIDACIYMKEESERRRGSILEQGCDLTGGHFLNTPDLGGTLEYLLWIFLPNTKVRDTLLLPERRKATHRAACFCHRNIIDIGYVCSVCLSIFCTYSPICSSCQTHFKLDVPTKVIKNLSQGKVRKESN